MYHIQNAGALNNILSLFFKSQNQLKIESGSYFHHISYDTTPLFPSLLSYFCAPMCRIPICGEAKSQNVTLLGIKEQNVALCQMHCLWAQADLHPSNVPDGPNSASSMDPTFYSLMPQHLILWPASQGCGWGSCCVSSSLLFVLGLTNKSFPIYLLCCFSSVIRRSLEREPHIHTQEGVITCFYS